MVNPSREPAGHHPLLEARGLHVGLSGRVVLRDVSLSLASGELLAIAGPNGAGKSTLLRVLAGVLRPKSGSVELEGDDLRSLSRRAIARRLAYLPQETWTSFSLTVRDVVRLGRFAHVGALASLGRQDLDAVEDAMCRADVQSLASRPLPTLSGGERRRVFLARAMAQQARVLVFDEPTSALDVGHACSVLDLLRMLADQGAAIVFSLHDLTLALRGPGKLLLLDHGRVSGRGDPATVLTGDAARAAFGVELVRVNAPTAIVPASPQVPNRS